MIFHHFKCHLALKLIFIYYFIVFCESNDNVSVRPTKLWRFLGNNDEALQQRFREIVEEYSVGRIKCLRYCIESKSTMEQMPQVLHLIWKLDMKRNQEMESQSIPKTNFRPEIMRNESIKSDVSQKQSNKCTFSIIIGCEISQDVETNISHVEKKFLKSLKPNLDILKDSSDNSSPALNFLNEKLIDKSNLMNRTEIGFRVQRDQAEVSAIVFGNITKIDLKMPIGAATEKTPRLTLAVTRMPSSGFRLNILNPPPGGWRIGLQGVNSNENYRLIVTSAVVPEFTDGDSNIRRRNGKEVSGFKDSYQPMRRKDEDISSRQVKTLVGKTDRMYTVEDSGMNREFAARMMSPEVQDDQMPFKFPIDEDNREMVNLNNSISLRLNKNQIEDRMIDRGSTILDDLNTVFNDELPIRKHLIVDVSPNTNLIANPGTIHRVTFDITNNHVLTVRHYFEARSSSLRIAGIRPPFGFIEIASGQTINVAVDIQIPPTVSDSVVHTVSLRVQGIENVEKTTNIYVRALGSRTYDDLRPTIYYYFNNNCALRTSAEKCLKSYWSVDITIQDPDSGLKSVTSTPKGVYPRTQYTSGTTSPIYFYYSGNCCNRVIEVTATDVSGNVYSRRIDVGEWYNLTEGEIAAVVIGVLFIILLIILIVITILYCLNRRESLDLPYSQRYGSRSAPSRTD